MKFRHSTLAKYMISYILVLGVAFVGFYAVVRFHLQREYKSAYQTETEAKIQNMTKVLDQNFSDILTMNYIIENDMAFINARYSESSYYRYLAVQELKKLAMTNGLVKDIFYFDIQNRDVLAANSSLFCKDETYYIKTTAGDLQIPQEFIYGEDVENLVVVMKTPSSSLYFFPGPKNSSKYRTVFLINEKQLHDLINMYAAQEISSVALLSGETIVFSTMPGDWETIENPAELERSAFIPVAHGRELYVQTIGTLKLAVVVLVDTNYFSDYATAAFQKSYLLMAYCLLVGLLIVLWAMKFTYLPLHDLARRITNRDTYISNDIVALGHAFDETLSEKETLETKIDYYKNMVKNAIQPASASSVSISDEQIDLLFQEDFHGAVLVAIFSPSHRHEPIDLERFSHPDPWILITLDPSAAQYTVLIGLPQTSEAGKAAVQTFLGEAAAAASCSVACSSFSSNPLEIARLYDMAKQAQRYSTGAPVTSYPEIQQFCEEQAVSPYPYQAFEDFSVCLRKLDFLQANEKVHEIIQLTAAYPNIFTCCIFMDILTLINTSMSANSIKFETYEKEFVETLEMCRETDFLHAEKKIRKNIFSILQTFETEVLNSGLQIPQITRFVEEHCFNPEFSLAFLADHFNVSSVYMSSFFTKRMKATLTDYVWELRLQRAKYLLETTDTPIDRISAEIGYDIPSSFRRKFKQEMGISPSEYRRRFK